MSGYNSALLLSAAHKVIDVNPFHLARPIYSDELDTAKSVSNFFNKKLKVINIYNKKYSPFDFNDDITYDLNFNYDFIKKDSVFFFLNNSDALIQRKFPNYKIFSGDGFPMSLTQDHFMVYPDRINREMGYGVHKDKRYPYSYSAFQGLLNKDSFIDLWDLRQTFQIFMSIIFRIDCFSSRTKVAIDHLTILKPRIVLDVTV